MTFLILLLLLAPVDWRYEARICGNVVVSEDQVLRARMRVMREGCWDVQVVNVTDGAYLVYGTKIERAVTY
jgi:hypothetical protein